MTAASLYPELEPLLTRVSKPIQYVGGEVNSVTKDWDAVDVRWALIYPDAYEVGSPNQGVQILYEVLNERDNILAERAYAVWPDLEAELRAAGLPSFTVDSQRSLAAFRCARGEPGHRARLHEPAHVAGSGGRPVHGSDRTEEDPLVVVGGHAAFNPEPISEFIDAAVLGDGEQAVGRISDLVAEWKKDGRPGGRTGILESLARTGVVYVPSLYDVTYGADGTIATIEPNRPGVPWRVSKHTLMDLDEWPYPKAPIVPVAETIHERMSVEIFRGCTRGCRFCQAGMITRPVRERSGSTVAEMIDCGIKRTGFNEVGLLSLSSADHSEIGEMAKGLADRYSDSRTSLSLPSTRVDAFNIELADELSRNGRRSGLTFAPEGGSERLRKVINKTVTEQDLIDTVAAAYASGWRHVKLYFMCGLPTETDDDVLQIARLAREVIRTGREVSGRRDIRCTVSIGGFVPKPHTPFQWAAQLSADETDRRLQLLRDEIRSDRDFGKSIGFRYHDGQPGVVEGLLARGDRRVGAVIEQAWRAGGRFDGWSEHFSFERWHEAAARAFAGQPVSLEWFTTRERDADEVLPWQHLDSGLDAEWLWQDWQDALAEDEVGDCRWTPCSNCGVCDVMDTEIQVGPSGKTWIPVEALAPTGATTPS